MAEDETETLLRALVQLVGRQTFPEDDLRQIVAPPGAGTKQLRAYNLCDGTRTQGEIAKKGGARSGQFQSHGRPLDRGGYHHPDGHRARSATDAHLPAFRDTGISKDRRATDVSDHDATTQIEAKLDTILRLLAIQIADGHQGLPAKVVTLSRAGMTPKDIAAVCGTTANSVSVRLAEAKKAAQAGRRKSAGTSAKKTEKPRKR